MDDKYLPYVYVCFVQDKINIIKGKHVKGYVEYFISGIIDSREEKASDYFT